MSLEDRLKRVLEHRLSRRALLQKGTRAAVGATGLALVGAGNSRNAHAQQQQQDFVFAYATHEGNVEDVLGSFADKPITIYQHTADGFLNWNSTVQSVLNSLQRIQPGPYILGGPLETLQNLVESGSFAATRIGREVQSQNADTIQEKVVFNAPAGFVLGTWRGPERNTKDALAWLGASAAYAWNPATKNFNTYHTNAPEWLNQRSGLTRVHTSDVFWAKLEREARDVPTYFFAADNYGETRTPEPWMLINPGEVWEAYVPLVFGEHAETGDILTDIYKWTDLVSPRYIILGNPQPQDVQTIEQVISELEVLTHVHFTEAQREEDANFTIYVRVPHSEWPALIPDVDPEFLRQAAGTAPTYEVSGKIVKANILVIDTDPQGAVDSLLREEITQAMGLPNDPEVDRGRASVFNPSKTTPVTEYLPIDAARIALHYHPAIKPLMTEPEVRAALEDAGFFAQ